MTGYVKLIAAGVVLLAFLTAAGIVYRHIKQAGFDEAVEAVAAQDKEAVDNVQAARNRISECRARGMRWERETGECLGR